MRLFFFLALSSAAPAATQEDEVALPPVAVPELPGRAGSLEGFVPAGWRVETVARGDLNRDGRSDVAFVLRTAAPVMTTTPYGMSAGRPFDSSPRLLAAAFADPAGGYRLAMQNHELIPRPYTPVQEGWMFEEGSLTIGRGAIVVRLAHLESSAGARTFRLRWQEGAFRLIGYDFTDVHRYSHCTNTISINYLTGRMRIGHADDGDSPERIRWSRLAVPHLLHVDWIGDGTAFDPEGAVSAIYC